MDSLTTGTPDDPLTARIKQRLAAPAVTAPTDDPLTARIKARLSPPPVLASAPPAPLRPSGTSAATVAPPSPEPAMAPAPSQDVALPARPPVSSQELRALPGPKATAVPAKFKPRPSLGETFTPAPLDPRVPAWAQNIPVPTTPSQIDPRALTERPGLPARPVADPLSTFGAEFLGAPEMAPGARGPGARFAAGAGRFAHGLATVPHKAAGAAAGSMLLGPAGAPIGSSLVGAGIQEAMHPGTGRETFETSLLAETPMFMAPTLGAALRAPRAGAATGALAGLGPAAVEGRRPTPEEIALTALPLAHVGLNAARARASQPRVLKPQIVEPMKEWGLPDRPAPRPPVVEAEVVDRNRPTRALLPQETAREVSKGPLPPVKPEHDVLQKKYHARRDEASRKELVEYEKALPERERFLKGHETPHEVGTKPPKTVEVSSLPPEKPPTVRLAGHDVDVSKLPRVLQEQIAKTQAEQAATPPPKSVGRIGGEDVDLTKLSPAARAQIEKATESKIEVSDALSKMQEEGTATSQDRATSLLPSMRGEVRQGQKASEIGNASTALPAVRGDETKGPALLQRLPNEVPSMQGSEVRSRRLLPPLQDRENEAMDPAAVGQAGVQQETARKSHSQFASPEGVIGETGLLGVRSAESRNAPRQLRPSAPSGVDVPLLSQSAPPRGRPGDRVVPEAVTHPGEDPLDRKVRKAVEAESTKGSERGAATIAAPLPRSPKAEPFTFSPEIETRFESARGVKSEHPVEVVKRLASHTKRALTSEWMTLPRGAKWEPARFALKRLQKQKAVAGDKAVNYIRYEGHGLDIHGIDAMRRRSILTDQIDEAVRYEKEVEARIVRGEDVPEGQEKYGWAFGLTEGTAIAESARLDAYLKRYPEVEAALERRKEVLQGVSSRLVKALRDAGYDIGDRFTRENYYRRMVHDYMDLTYANSVLGTGTRLKTPTSRGYMKGRTSGGRDYNTEYAEAEFSVLAQMIEDTEIARTITRIKRDYDIAPKLRAEAKVKSDETGKRVDWRSLLPEGITLWQPREGSAFYRTHTIPENLARDVLTGALVDVGLSPEDIRTALAKGGALPQLAIPNELAETLNALYEPKSQNLFMTGLRGTMKGWKSFRLFAPRSFPKYTMRNLSGDLDKTIVGNTNALLWTPKSLTDLISHFLLGRPMSTELQRWFDDGGFESALSVQEIGELRRLDALRKYFPQGPTTIDMVKAPFRKYWHAVRVTDSMRESILRYANYLSYLDQMKKSGGAPKNFGASVPEEITALPTPEERAFKMSNDLIGAYDSVSVFGQALREYLIPFWSYRETNFRSYTQLIKNAARDKKFAGTLGRKFLSMSIRSPIIAARVGLFAAKALAMWAMLQTFNVLTNPDGEDDLPEDVKTRPHLVFPWRDKDGKPVYFSRLGALGDFLSWFGADVPAQYAHAWLNGRRTTKEIALDMAKQPVEETVNSITPAYKMPFEMAVGQSTYPSVFKPSTIRDRGLYFFKTVGLDKEYIEAKGMPSRGYTSSLGEVFYYKSDPDESALFEMRDEKYRYMRLNHIGGGSGGRPTPRSNALYYYKQAVRFEDKDAATKYLNEYVLAGGTQKGLKQSMDALHPLDGLSGKHREVFIESLDEAGRAKLDRAIRYYETLRKDTPKIPQIPKAKAQ